MAKCRLHPGDDEGKILESTASDYLGKPRRFCKNSGISAT
jgi:hypothetical protein